MLVFFVCLYPSVSAKTNIPKPGEVLNKFFFRPQVTVSQFPPFFEFFLQKIQSQFSTYVHEDLSRPPTWEKPVYTLSPQDQLFFSESQSTSEATTSVTSPSPPEEHVEEVDSTEKLFEIIQDHNKTDADVEVLAPATNLDDTTKRLFEVIKSVTAVRNESFVLITPRTSTYVPFNTHGLEHTTERYIDPELELRKVQRNW
ncbi:hypothetical protein JTB14_021270 [Gonioctena quinquepunctata]|nr:hypothetical protein JTB14_021270 [Gonioctena quinquepunctata]